MKYSPINYTFDVMSVFYEDLTQEQFNKIVKIIEVSDVLGRWERELIDEFFEIFDEQHTLIS